MDERAPFLQALDGPCAEWLRDGGSVRRALSGFDGRSDDGSDVDGGLDHGLLRAVRVSWQFLACAPATLDLGRRRNRRAPPVVRSHPDDLRVRRSSRTTPSFQRASTRSRSLSSSLASRSRSALCQERSPTSIRTARSSRRSQLSRSRWSITGPEDCPRKTSGRTSE
jgi:hypothetical protein